MHNQQTHTTRRRATGLCLAFAVLLTAAFTSQDDLAEATAVAYSNGAPTDQVLRDQLGLAAAQPAAEDLAVGELGDAVEAEWGLSVSQSEAAELSLRSRVLAASGIINEYAARVAPDEFGGLFMDHEAGGVLVVSFTGRAEEHLSELRARFPFPERLRARTVAFTEQRLRSAVDLLTQRVADYEAAGFQVGMIVPDLVSNSVQVSGVGDVAAGAEAMAASVPAHMLEVKLEPLPVASDRNNNYPLKGGLRITRPSSPGFVSVCSSAFVTYYDSGSVVRRVRNYTLLTAGHCGAQGDDYAHGGRVFGEVIRDEYPGNAVTQDCDCMAISMNRLDRSNSVYVTASTAQPMVRAQSEGERVIGEPVTLSGVTSGILSGNLLATGVTVNYEGTPPLRDQSLASYTSSNGDSGGSVYAGGIAKGIHSGSATLSDGTRRGIFTTIGNALRELAVTLNT